MFNLVYETNVASTKIWDSLGFERIGRVKKCGVLKSYPGRKIDAIVQPEKYGRDKRKKFEKNKERLKTRSKEQKVMRQSFKRW